MHSKCTVFEKKYTPYNTTHIILFFKMETWAIKQILMYTLLYVGVYPEIYVSGMY
jgi:hypothetical protein